MFRDEPAWTREEIYYIAERAHRLYRQGRFHDAGILFEGLTAVDRKMSTAAWLWPPSIWS